MNWTGGSLQLHSKSKSNKTLNAQRQHFTRARIQTQRGFQAPKPPRFSLFSSPDNSSAYDKTADEDIEDIEPRSRGDGTTKNRRQTTSKASINEDHRPRSADRLLVAAAEADKVEKFHLRNTFAAAKCELLQRTDWLNVNAIKPLHIIYDPPKEVQRVGRHRRVAGHNNMRNANPQDVACSSSRPSNLFCTPTTKSRAQSEGGHSTTSRLRAHQSPVERAFDESRNLATTKSRGQSHYNLVSSEREDRQSEEHRAQSSKLNAIGDVIENITRDFTPLRGILNERQNVQTPQLYRVPHLVRTLQDPTGLSSAQSYASHARVKSEGIVYLSGTEFDDPRVTCDIGSPTEKPGRVSTPGPTSFPIILHTPSRTPHPVQQASDPRDQSPSQQSDAQTVASVHKDAKEAWVRHIFAGDLDRVQRDFEFHPTPTKRLPAASHHQSRLHGKSIPTCVYTPRPKQRLPLRAAGEETSLCNETVLSDVEISLPSCAISTSISPSDLLSESDCLGGTYFIQSTPESYFTYVSEESDDETVRHVVPSLHAVSLEYATAESPASGMFQTSAGQLKRKRSAISFGMISPRDVTMPNFPHRMPTVPFSEMNSPKLPRSRHSRFAAAQSGFFQNVKGSASHRSYSTINSRAFDGGSLTSVHDAYVPADPPTSVRHTESIILQPTSMTIAAAKRDCTALLGNGLGKLSSNRTALLQSDLRSSPPLFQESSSRYSA